MKRGTDAPVEIGRPIAVDARPLLDALRLAREAMFAAWETPEVEALLLPPCQVCHDDPAMRLGPCRPATCPPPEASFAVRERHAQSHWRTGRLAICRCGQSPLMDRDQRLRQAVRDCVQAYTEALPTGRADDWSRVQGSTLPEKYATPGAIADLLPVLRG